jgi:hypothetical protein
MYSAAALYRTGTLQQVGLSAAVVHHVGPAIVGGKHSDFAVYHGHWALGTGHWALVWAFVKNMPKPLFWLLLPHRLA